MSVMDGQNLEQEIKEIVAKIIEVDAVKILPDSNLVEDLGADSMQALEIMVALDKKYKISIAESDLPKMTSVKQIAGIVNGLIKHA